MTDLGRLVRLHAHLRAKAVTADDMATRLERRDDMERADIERANAEQYRADAQALAEVLEPLGVHVPDPRQLSLMGDGQ